MRISTVAKEVYPFALKDADSRSRSYGHVVEGYIDLVQLLWIFIACHHERDPRLDQEIPVQVLLFGHRVTDRVPFELALGLNQASSSPSLLLRFPFRLWTCNWHRRSGLLAD